MNYSDFQYYKKVYRFVAGFVDDIDAAYTLTDKICDLLADNGVNCVLFPSYTVGPIPTAAMPLLDLRCPRCGKQLRESQLAHYDAYCEECDEDFFSFEAIAPEEKVFRAELHYGTYESHDSLFLEFYHAFELTGPGEGDSDKISEHLAELLDTTTDDENYQYKSMLVKLPDSVVKEIQQAGKEGHR